MSEQESAQNPRSFSDTEALLISGKAARARTHTRTLTFRPKRKEKKPVTLLSKFQNEKKILENYGRRRGNGISGVCWLLTEKIRFDEIQHPALDALSRSPRRPTRYSPSYVAGAAVSFRHPPTGGQSVVARFCIFVAPLRTLFLYRGVRIKSLQGLVWLVLPK